MLSPLMNYFLYLFVSRKEKSKMFPARFELATFRVLGGRDNHYTTETTVCNRCKVRGRNTRYLIPRTYTQIHTPTVVQRGGGGVDGTPPRSF